MIISIFFLVFILRSMINYLSTMVIFIVIIQKSLLQGSRCGAMRARPMVARILCILSVALGTKHSRALVLSYLQGGVGTFS